MKFLNSYDAFNISEGLKYHIKNGESIIDNIFRPGSESFYTLVEEVRKLYSDGVIILENLDKVMFEDTDIGMFGMIDNQKVPLDIPMLNDEVINEAEYKGKEVELNKPMRSSSPKKYKVYVKNPKTGKVIVVNFGDVNGGLTSKINDPEARKNFASRHDCKNKKDKTKAGYWSCNLPRYAKMLSLSGGGNYYW